MAGITAISRYHVLPVLALVASLLSSTAWSHQGLSDDTAWHACDSKQLGQACAYVSANELEFNGSCRAVRDTLLCIRNRPLQLSAASGVTAGTKVSQFQQLTSSQAREAEDASH